MKWGETEEMYMVSYLPKSVQRRAGNSSGMLSPSADQYSGRTGMSKETLSPSADQCCMCSVCEDSFPAKGF